MSAKKIPSFIKLTESCAISQNASIFIIEKCTISSRHDGIPNSWNLWVYSDVKKYINATPFNISSIYLIDT